MTIHPGDSGTVPKFTPPVATNDECISGNDRQQFIRHIKAEIQGLADEIADLRSLHFDDPQRSNADRLIAIHQRSIQRLRGHLPLIPGEVADTQQPPG